MFCRFYVLVHFLFLFLFVFSVSHSLVCGILFGSFCLAGFFFTHDQTAQSVKRNTTKNKMFVVLCICAKMKQALKTNLYIVGRYFVQQRISTEYTILVPDNNTPFKMLAQ